MYLNCHSYYSLRYGTLSEEDLLSLAKKNGCSALALTDINNTSACLSFVRKAEDHGIKPILGIDFRNGINQCYVTLAKNNDGFLEINDFLSDYLYKKIDFPEKAPLFRNTYVIYPFEKALELDIQKLTENEFIGISIKDLRKLRFSKFSDFTEKLVLLNTVTFHSKRDYNIHRLLRAIANNELLSKLPKEEQADPNDRFIEPKLLKEIFVDSPHILNNSQKLTDLCSISFDFSANKPSQPLKTVEGNDELDYKKLYQLCRDGLPRRYKVITQDIENRLVKELKLIQHKNFVSFFLINWKIIQYAQNKGYYHVGRGSGANSIVAYLLGITDVDPIALDLYFERFMNLYRETPPDFDIDFSTWDREDVTRYIFEEFGKNGQAALLGSYVTFKYSGAVRELGKVFGLPKYEIDKLSDGKYNPDKIDKLSKLVLKYGSYLHDRPNYLSIHAGGILISEKPIHYFSATHLPPKGFPTVQFDMHIAEDVGLYKFDILGQRGLGKIKDAIAIIRENHPDIELLDIHDTQPLFEDKRINDMIARADCIGCFYVESPAMRMLLQKLGVDEYQMLVAASSIIRPGVAKSGMMREYILRHKYPERRKEAHPVLWKIMPETYGVMVYQEDVIKVAHYYADLDLGEADVLRRGMSGKYRSREEFQVVREKFINNCLKKGEEKKMILDVWRQIESFAGYAFAKGHSASYAVESYQSLYLKCYYPLEYMVATVNNGGGFYNVETYIHEARMKGGRINAPCINKSEIQTTIYGTDIYLGFQHIQLLEKKSIIKIINSRLSGEFLSLNDFIERVPLSIEQLDLLIRINAFRSIRSDKRNLLWEAHYKENRIVENEMQQQIFKVSMRDFILPKFEISSLEEAFDQLEILGFPLFSPFILLRKTPENELLSVQLSSFLNKTVVIYGYLVTAKNTRTSKGDLMQFGTFLDQEGKWLDTVHFPPVVQKYPLNGKGIYKITGKVVEEFDFLSLEVQVIERMAYIPDPRFDPTYNRKEVSLLNSTSYKP
ncbi:MAG: DNA polymerase III subunit alpha, partial [Leeuwenhoekiella sp.]